MGKKLVPWMLFSLLLLMSFTACNTASPATSGAKTEPVLSSTLKSGCDNPGVYATDKTGLAVGSQVINFTLKDTDGNEVRLSKLLAQKPVVLIFGSFT
jgi:cytochrome oxidase Cu insertion factor (SCO1/SenC/PrrC family)